MTGRWENLTDRQQTAVLLNLRGWLQLGDDPDIRAALAVLDPPGTCPTCGPTATEPHPRLPGVVRCANCKAHGEPDRPVVAPVGTSAGLHDATVDLPATEVA